MTKLDMLQLAAIHNQAGLLLLEKRDPTEPTEAKLARLTSVMSLSALADAFAIEAAKND